MNGASHQARSAAAMTPVPASAWSSLRRDSEVRSSILDPPAGLGPSGSCLCHHAIAFGAGKAANMMALGAFSKQACGREEAEGEAMAQPKVVIASQGRANARPITGSHARSRISMRSTIISSASAARTKMAVGLLLWSCSTGKRLAVGGEHELKHSALGLVRDNPQSAIVGLDDRTAYRQTQPHPARFCSEQWIEYQLVFLRADSCSGVRHRYDDARAVADLGPHFQNPHPILGRHRIDRVGDQVQKHLLQLDSISSYRRQLLIRLGFDQYPGPLQIAAR